MFLGANNVSGGTPTYYPYDAGRGAFSLLHLNGGNNGASLNESGYRNWMKTGITYTDNADLSYIGMRILGGDTTETTIAWANDTSRSYGPDDLVFRFISEGGTPTSVSTNFALSNDLDGLHIARFTPTGQIGFGNTFGINSVTGNVGYVRPQNLLHMSLNNNNPVWLQITNQGTPANGFTDGTGQTNADGLTIGVPATTATNLEARIDQKENDRLTFFTNTSSGGGERIRVTHIGALNNNTTFNPGGLANNLTRIGISLNPTTPITRQLSLLHLGSDVANLTTNDGWRNWMNAGMFVSQSSDHAYFGMQPSNNGADAVLSWGDDLNGPDNFRIAFTATNGTPVIPAGTLNGSEGLRMSPTLTGICTGIGGDPNNGNLYSGTNGNPGAPLEVNALAAGQSGLRFTDLNSSATPQPNPGNGVLSVDANGDVIYVKGGGNGVGGDCGTATGLTTHYEIPLNQFTYNYTAGIDNSMVNIGYPTCNPVLPIASRLLVYQPVVDPSSVQTGVFGVLDGTNSNTYSSQGYQAGIYGYLLHSNSDGGAGVRGMLSIQSATMGHRLVVQKVLVFLVQRRRMIEI